MILTKTNLNGITEAIYESSNILASSYNESASLLTITFKTGKQYTYEGINNVLYSVFENADSQGKVLNSSIKQFPSNYIGDIDPSSIEASIQRVKDAEKKNFELGIVNRMKDVINRFESFNTFDVAGMDMVVTMLNKYKNA